MSLQGYDRVLPLLICVITSDESAQGASNDQTWFAMIGQLKVILLPIPPRKPSRVRWCFINVYGGYCAHSEEHWNSPHKQSSL